jgi:F-type H+-transporting ATPase subunit alpha
MPVEEQCVVIFAGTRGYLDDISTAEVAEFEAGLLAWFRTRHADQLDAIRSGGKIVDEDAFESAIKAFAEQFQSAGADTSLPGAEAQPDSDTTVKSSPVHLPEQEATREDEA